MNTKPFPPRSAPRPSRGGALATADAGLQPRPRRRRLAQQAGCATSISFPAGRTRPTLAVAHSSATKLKRCFTGPASSSFDDKGRLRARAMSAPRLIAQWPRPTATRSASTASPATAPIAPDALRQACRSTPTRTSPRSACCGRLPNLLIVRTGLPAKTVPELIALATRQSRQVLVRPRPARDTTVHPQRRSSSRSWPRSTLLHVPYRRPARRPSRTCWPGQVDMIFDKHPELASPQMRGGKGRVGLAVTSLKAQPGGARDSRHGRVPAGASEPFNSWGGNLRPGRHAARRWSTKLSALAEKALESDDGPITSYLQRQGRHADVAEPDRPTAAYRAADEKRLGAGDQRLPEQEVD